MARDLVQKDPFAESLLRQAEERLRMPLARLMFEGPESELQATQNAQPAIVFHSLALLNQLRHRGGIGGLVQGTGLSALAVAGHSLGEFAGLVSAGGLHALDALVAVRARGEAMASAAPSGSGMAAVLGLDDATVERVCAEVPGVVPANYNAPRQVVISGSDAALEAAIQPLQQAGARRVIRLPVSAAFHSPLMASAAEAFRNTWEQIPLEPLLVSQVFNGDAEVHRDPAEIRELMVGQLTGPVRWTQSVRRLAALGVDTFVEIGPGRTLTGLVKKVLPQAVLHNIEDMAGLDAFLKVAHA